MNSHRKVRTHTFGLQTKEVILKILSSHDSFMKRLGSDCHSDQLALAAGDHIFGEEPSGVVCPLN